MRHWTLFFDHFVSGLWQPELSFDPTRIEMQKHHFGTLQRLNAFWFFLLVCLTAAGILCIVASIMFSRPNQLLMNLIFTPRFFGRESLDDSTIGLRTIAHDQSVSCSACRTCSLSSLPSPLSCSAPTSE